MTNKKKKVIVSSAKKTSVNPRTATRNSTGSSSPNLLFGKENYKWMIIGIALIVVGMLLMIGGFNENPNVWDESKIYGFQRTVLAPAVILGGLVVNVYAIFKTSPNANA